MYLKHNDLIIRNATEKDAVQLAMWWNDGRVMAHAGSPRGRSNGEKHCGQFAEGYRYNAQAADR